MNGKSCILSIALATVLTGCTDGVSVYEKGNVEPFTPREYYRAHTNLNEIGAATSADIVKKMTAKISSLEGVREAVVLTHNNEHIIAVRPAPYLRKNENALINDIKPLLENTPTVKVITDPGMYRTAKRLWKKKNGGLIDEEWMETWKSFLEKAAEKNSPAGELFGQ
ncbi:YhcN/YlaJ family sporulation lipoprotein [Bacillus marinisedimentorum]|uniref:YhcN/YlaJ family sporulation lipoprotein n=1 Tax=Bacillus marinisedimentorum TaxID=1821260 RepID=UPI000871DFC8|nr:YhcN/YlaJ family sporulation lipoprotein [Bacillus marinisedimentorum]